MGNTEDFEQVVSLWQVVPSGMGYGLAQLRAIVDSQLNGTGSSLRSVLITGEAAELHGSAFLRAMGYENINQIHGALLQPAHRVVEFFCHSMDTAHLITHVEHMITAIHPYICQAVRCGQYAVYDYGKRELVAYSVPSPIVLTASNKKNVPAPMVEAVEYVVHIEPYRAEQLELVALQRLKYSGLTYQDEQVLRQIVRGGRERYDSVIDLLKLVMLLVKADGRQVVGISDVEKALRMKGVRTAGQVKPPF